MAQPVYLRRLRYALPGDQRVSVWASWKLFLQYLREVIIVPRLVWITTNL